MATIEVIRTTAVNITARCLAGTTPMVAQHAITNETIPAITGVAATDMANGPDITPAIIVVQTAVATLQVDMTRTRCNSIDRVNVHQTLCSAFAPADVRQAHCSAIDRAAVSQQYRTTAPIKSAREQATVAAATRQSAMPAWAHSRMPRTIEPHFGTSNARIQAARLARTDDRQITRRRGTVRRRRASKIYSRSH